MNKCPVEYSGTADDQSANIMKWIKAQPPGSEVVFDGTYLVEEPIRMEHFDLVMDEATFFNPVDHADKDNPADKDRPVVQTIGGAVRGHLTCVGPMGSRPGYLSAFEGQHALSILGTSVALDVFNGSHVRGDGVYWARGVDSKGQRMSPATGSIHDVYVRDVARTGFTCVASRNVFGFMLDVADCGRHIIDVEPGPTGAEDTLICRVKAGYARLGFAAANGEGPVRRLHILNVVSDYQVSFTATGNPGAEHDDIRLENWTSTKKFAVGMGSMKLPPEQRQAIINLKRVSNAQVLNVTQPFLETRPTWLVDATNCPGLVLSGNAWPGGLGELQPSA